MAAKSGRRFTFGVDVSVPGCSIDSALTAKTVEHGRPMCTREVDKYSLYFTIDIVSWKYLPSRLRIFFFTV